MTTDHDLARVKAYNVSRITSRQIDELVGICKGATLDGHVSQGEAEYLLRWLESNRECADKWPANVLYPRIKEMLQDDVFDSNEELELLDLLVKLAGGQPDNSNASTRLPLDEPPALLQWHEKSFCVTGLFAYGARSKVHMTIEALGGKVESGVRKDLDYLVIGSIGTETWKHSSFGTKIVKAMDYKSNGCKILILSESYWASQIP